MAVRTMEFDPINYNIANVLQQEATLIEELTEKVQEQQRYITQLQANKR